LDLVGFGIVLPLSPYYAEHFGASALAVGLLQASYSLMQFIFAPVWGRLSDKVGRRPIILMSIAGGCISYFVFAAAGSLTVLFASRIFQGIFAANISATQAYVADVTSKQDRSKGMGLIGAALGLGFIFGPFFGGLLIKLGPDVGAYFSHHPEGIFGMGFPALIAGILCLLNLILAFFYLPESLTAENRTRAQRERIKEKRSVLILRYLKRPETGWLIFIFFLSGFAMGNMEATLALFTQARLNYNVTATGNLLGFVGIIMTFTQGYLIRKVAPRIGERRMIIVGPFLSGAALLGTGFIHSAGAIYFFMAILAVGSGMTSPALLGAVSLVTPSEEQGAVMGTTQSLGSLARFLGPACGGYLFGLFDGAPYYAGGALMFCSLFIAVANSSKVPDVRDPDVAVL
jgi:MFS transporter, DHA1 family, tetracycline resistance protein